MLQVTYSLELAQFYMWAQTPCAVLLAVFLPTGTPPVRINGSQCLAYLDQSM